MTKRTPSKALLFVFAASCPSSGWGRPGSHDCGFGTKWTMCNYDHTNGKGLKGFIFVKNKH